MIHLYAGRDREATTSMHSLNWPNIGVSWVSVITIDWLQPIFIPFIYLCLLLHRSLSHFLFSLFYLNIFVGDYRATFLCAIPSQHGLTLNSIILCSDSALLEVVTDQAGLESCEYNGGFRFKKKCDQCGFTILTSSHFLLFSYYNYLLDYFYF